MPSNIAQVWNFFLFATFPIGKIGRMKRGSSNLPNPSSAHPACNVLLTHLRHEMELCSRRPHAKFRALLLISHLLLPTCCIHSFSFKVLTHLFYPLFFFPHSYPPAVHQSFILFNRTPILPFPTSAPSFNRIPGFTRRVL